MVMNAAIDNLVQKLFRVNKLEEINAPDIEQLAGRYPYYAPLQYLLANKYRQIDDAQYRLQITKTAVFFSNPHWLNDLLLPDKDDIAASNAVNTFNGAIPGVPPQPGSIEEEQLSAAHDEPGMDEPVSSEVVPASDPGDISPVAEDVILPELSEHPVPDEALSVEKEDTGDATVAADAAELLSPNASEPFAATEDDVKLPPEEIPSPAETVAAEPLEDVSDNAPAAFPYNTNGESPDFQGEAFKNEPNFAEQPESSSTVPADEPVVKGKIMPEESIPLMDRPSTMLGKLQALSVPGGNSPVISFEPLYTVDYFASQGIRLNHEEGNDKLSRKLRSFTEWLKTMKRLHPEKLEQEMDTGRAAVIQHIAEHSNELEDVVTEAMAEVYARQGLRTKAAEVYQKLSLLNPDKRAYFAARISKLNDI